MAQSLLLFSAIAASSNK